MNEYKSRYCEMPFFSHRQTLQGLLGRAANLILELETAKSSNRSHGKIKIKRETYVQLTGINGEIYASMLAICIPRVQHIAACYHKLIADFIKVSCKQPSTHKNNTGADSEIISSMLYKRIILTYYTNPILLLEAHQKNATFRCTLDAFLKPDDDPACPGNCGLSKSETDSAIQLLCFEHKVRLALDGQFSNNQGRTQKASDEKGPGYARSTVASRAKVKPPTYCCGDGGGVGVSQPQPVCSRPAVVGS